MAGFAQQVNIFAKDTEKQLIKDCRQELLALFSRIVDLTPVASGRAKGNWICGTGPVASNESGEPDKDGQATKGRIKAALDKIDLTRADAVWLVNNTPYIQELEYGSSKQAPNGMVRLAASTRRR